VINDPSSYNQRVVRRTQSEVASINFEFADYKLSIPLREALMTSPVIQAQRRMDWAFMKDMLCDVVLLNSNSDQLARDALRRYVIKSKDSNKSFGQSTRIDLLRSTFSKGFPIQDKFVMVVETSKEVHYLVAPNILQQWAWTRALEKAMDGTAAQVSCCLRFDCYASCIMIYVW
jgi:hypothetical protein